MHGFIEIDKSGRCVLPKKLRDTLHLRAGTRLAFQQHGSKIVLEPEVKPATMSMKNGVPVFHLGSPLPSDHVEWVSQHREDHADDIFER